MEAKITILAPFFEAPSKEFGIRELSRTVGINHTTVRQRLIALEKDGYLVSRKERAYSLYQFQQNRKSLNLKLYFNLERLRGSGIIEDLEREYDLPVIVLFGSYAFAMDDLESDIDICLISDIKKVFDSGRYALHRKVSIHQYTKTSWKNSGKTNPHLINSICNGLVLSGELEVLH